MNPSPKLPSPKLPIATALRHGDEALPAAREPPVPPRSAARRAAASAALRPPGARDRRRRRSRSTRRPRSECRECPAVSTRILHVSDLHTGTREDPAVERAVAALIETTRPQLVIATGDLTHRGLRGQHERAATFLRSFGLPLHVIPGNHDIPVHLPGPLHADVRGVRAALGNHGAGPPVAGRPRRRPELRSGVAPPVRRDPGAPARRRRGGARNGRAGRRANRDAAPPPRRGSVAFAEEARRPPQPRRSPDSSMPARSSSSPATSTRRRSASGVSSRSPRRPASAE